MAGLMSPVLDLLCVFTGNSDVGRVRYPLSADAGGTMGIGAEEVSAAKLQPDPLTHRIRISLVSGSVSMAV